MPPSQLADLAELLANPREALDIEMKEWLDLADHGHRATVAKEIIALANHGGGYLVVGFGEDEEGQYAVDPNRPADLAAWSPDSIQGIVQKYADPVIQCDVQHIEHPNGSGKYPIIGVPGGHRVPVRAKAGSPDGKKLVPSRIYVRRPGPASEEPQSASEWDDLLERCLRNRRNELLDGIRDLLAGHAPQAPPSTPTRHEQLDAFVEKAERRWQTLVSPLPPPSDARLPYGHYDCAFALDGDFDRISLLEFRELLRHALANHSGWPPFVVINREPYTPRPVEGTIESWHGPDLDGSVDVPAHCDFWRMDPDGLLYTRRGFQEDARYKAVEPGTTFDITTPTWRIGEALLQAFYVARALRAENASLIARFSWSGLAGRKLISLGNPGRLLFEHPPAHQDSILREITVPVASIDTALPEIVHEILAPVYELFDFFNLPKRLVDEELQNLRRHRF